MTSKELAMQTITRLPEPCGKHATCAWCAHSFDTVIDLIDHVDDTHLTDKRDIHTLPLPAWNPTADEVAAIVREMRPIIAAFAERDRQRLSAAVPA
jgi:hypothetical protein